MPLLFTSRWGSQYIVTNSTNRQFMYNTPMYTYEHPRPAVTVDIVVFNLYTGLPYVLLIQRAAEPFIGMWALPGGFVQMDEGLEEAARRELEEEIGLKAVYLEQLYTFGRPDRDPRGRVITVVYLVLIPESTHKKVEGRDDAARADWFSVQHLPTLAFDHAEILAYALARLNKKQQV